MASEMEQSANQDFRQGMTSNCSHARVSSTPQRTNLISQSSAPCPLQVVETSPFEPRPSSASSIVSTRTGLTVETLQEETRSIRSIDLLLGGRLFHINRDGSRISVLEQNDLPPYSPPLHQHSLEDAKPTESTRHSVGGLSLPLRATDHISESVDNSEGHLVTRSPSFNPGPDRISVISKRRSASQGNIPEGAYSLNSPLRRRNGVRLPKILTSIPHLDDTASMDIVSADNGTDDARVTRSAGPLMGGNGTHSRSPSYFGAHATGDFPTRLCPVRPLGSPSSHQRSSGHANMQQSSIPHSPTEFHQHFADGSTSPTVDSENDINIHYSRLIRSLDQILRRALNPHDKELAVMRERLLELDQVYRKELKSRDFIIDDLQKRLQHVEEQLQSRIDTLQSELEEQWESRWRQRDQHYMERMRQRVELAEAVGRGLSLGMGGMEASGP